MTLITSALAWIRTAIQTSFARRLVGGAVFLALVVFTVGQAQAQTTIYSQNFGTGSALPTGWTAGGANSANVVVANSSSSSGYSTPITASGGSNLEDAGGTGTSTAIVAGQISTVGYNSIQVIFGARISSATYTGTVTFDWSSDGTTWNSISYTQVSGTDGNWHVANGGSYLSLPAGAAGQSDLRFRFTFTRTATGGNYRVDDFTVRGTANTAPVVTSSAATSVAATTATLNGSVTSDGGSTVTERGFVYKTSSGVTIADNKTTVSGTTGSYTLPLTGLTGGTTYYFKAYAINGVGTTLSSPELSFTTTGTTPPTLTAAGSATVDAPFTVTFTDSSAWRAAITSITVGGITLSSSAYTISGGQIVFNPANDAADSLIRTPGTKTIAVIASTYSATSVSQYIAAGAAASQVITTQPVTKQGDGSALLTQPVVVLQDQYGNTATNSTANVVASVGSGLWTLGGTTTKAAVLGVATFTDLTATSAAGVSGATIIFNSTGLAAVASSSFNLGFTPGNLAVLLAAASANNTTCSLLELSPATANQATPVNTLAINGTTGSSALRFSGSAASTAYLADSADGSMVVFSGANTNDTGANVNTYTNRGVGAFSSAGAFALKTTYIGANGNQTRGASSFDNTRWIVGDQGGIYTNGATAPSPAGNFRAVKIFGGVAYVMTTATTMAPVQTLSGSPLATNNLPGLPLADGNMQDYYFVSSGNNGTFDVLYLLDTSSGSAGTIFKYSLVSGTWTANGSYATSFGGFGLCAATNGSGGAFLYVTTGTGAITANKVIALNDTAGYNSTISITTGNNVTLYTAAAGTILKGIAFAPATPAIGTPGTLAAVNTTYGTASSTTSFTVAGANIVNGITITPPAGFEVSQTSSSSGFAGSGTAITVGAAGTIASTIYVRLATNAPVVGSYNSQNIVLTSLGAATVNVATAASGNTVSPASLTITANGQIKYYGTALALGTTVFTPTGLQNGETIGAVTLTANGSPTGDTAAAAQGSYTITPSAATGGTFNAGNYTITYATGTLTVNPEPLTITANNVIKSFGTTLASPVTGSTAFTSSGLVNSETIGSVTITYGTGAAAGDPVAVNTGQVTPSAATGGTFTAGNYSINYVSGNLTVSASPTITTSGTLAALSTTYGTASAATSFSVSGVSLAGNLTVTPPAGFEFSLSSGSGYTTSLPITASGTLASTTVYVRLASSTAAGTYSGNVAVTGGGATEADVATASSTVSPQPLTITGITATNKVYDGTTMAGFTGTPAYVGLTNGDAFTVSGAASATFAFATVSNNIPVTVSGYTAPSANYTLTQPALAANITPLALTVSGATVTTKFFDGTSNAVITGESLVGVINPDVVTVGGGGYFADTNANTGIAVTANLTLGGAASTNYSLIQPTGLTGTITPTNQVITFAALPGKTNGAAPFTLTATANTGLPVTFSSDNPAVATISGNTVTIVGTGIANITASQAGSQNYNPASATQPLNVGTALGAGDVAVIAFGPSGTDKFAVVLLKAVVAGTTIVFTDNGLASSTTGRTGEGFLTYAAQTDLPAGTVLTWQNGQSIAGTGWSSATPSGFVLNASGEQLFVFQGDPANWATQSGITLIYGIETAVTWLTSGVADSSHSYAPDASLLPGADLFQVDTKSDFYLTATTLSDTAANIITYVTTYVTTPPHFTTSNSAQTLPAYTQFTVLIPQTIAAITPSAITKTYGDSPYSVATTASSGLTVSYASDTPSVATVDASGNVTIVGAGSAIITASQAGNGTYFAATPVTQTLTVNPATPTIGATGGTFTYDGTPKAGGGTATGGKGESLAVTLSYSGIGGTTYGPTATAPSAAGTYTVTVSTTGDANNTANSSSAAALTIINPAHASQLTGAVQASSGVFAFAFTNYTGLSFSVLATNDLTVPAASWPVVGTAVEYPAGSGNYQYTNTSATGAQQFYIIRQP